MTASDKPTSYSAFENIFIPYDQPKVIEEGIDRLVRYGTGDWTTHKPAKLFLLTGDRRSGKTAIMARAERRYGRATATIEHDIRPTIYYEIPRRCTVKGLATGLLLRLGDKFADKGTEVIKMSRLAMFLHDLNVKLLILDEGHHLINPDNNAIIYEVSEAIKSILNFGVCPIILGGMPELELVVDNKANRQLRGRLLARHRIQPIDWRDPEQQLTFRLILHEFDNTLPLPERSNLGEPDTALRIWYASSGLIGLVTQLLEAALTTALDLGEQKLSRERLAQAYEELALHETNPFRISSLSDPAPDDSAGASINDGSSRRTTLRKGTRTPRPPSLPKRASDRDD